MRAYHLSPVSVSHQRWIDMLCFWEFGDRVNALHDFFFLCEGNIGWGREWVSKWVSEWVSEWASEWESGWLSERVREGVREEIRELWEKLDHIWTAKHSSKIYRLTYWNNFRRLLYSLWSKKQNQINSQLFEPDHLGPLIVIEKEKGAYREIE